MNTVNEVQESIKIALDAADAATDVTSEYNKIKNENKKLEASVKQVHKFTTIIFGISILAAVIGLSLTALIYSRTMNELSAMTSTSREALVVFAENVDTVNKSIESLNSAMKTQTELLKVNKNLVSAVKEMEANITKANQMTVGELSVISSSLIRELKSFSKKADENNKRLNLSFKNFSIESSKALEKTMKKMSKNPIYNKIIANQSMQSQQINALIKKNNSLVSKMKDKAAMIKYP